MVSNIVYDAVNNRIALTTTQLVTLSFDVDTGSIAQLDSLPTSGNSSHLSLNWADTAVYVASGTSVGRNINSFKSVLPAHYSQLF